MILQEETQEPQSPFVDTITTEDGWIVCVETGEILGCESAPELVVFDRDTAEWVLERIQDAKAKILADEFKLRAIADCIETRMKQQRRRLEWLERRFAPDLEHFTRQALASSKERTLILDHGRLGLRKTPGSIKVIDPALAVQWAEIYAPEAIKVERSVLVTPLKGRTDLPPALFDVRGPDVRFTIETGIK